MSEAPSLTRVFVYGSLLPGAANEGVARAGGPYQAEAATLDGHTLYHLDPEGYPGIVPGTGRVEGMLYTYAPADWPQALGLLDELEEVDLTPATYRRVQVTVTAGGAATSAWTYLYARPERLAGPGVRHLPSGRWLDRGAALP